MAKQHGVVVDSDSEYDVASGLDDGDDGALVGNRVGLVLHQVANAHRGVVANNPKEPYASPDIGGRHRSPLGLRKTFTF